MPRSPRPPVIRFLEKIRVSNHIHEGSPCWDWTGAKNHGNGYGQLRADSKHNGRRVGPHQFSYEYFVGPIPPGKEPEHLCNRRECCSPLHLEPVSHQENMKRRGHRQTHCKRGHEFDYKNTYWTPRGSRSCRRCRCEKQKEFQARNPGYVDKYRKGRERRTLS